MSNETPINSLGSEDDINPNPELFFEKEIEDEEAPPILTPFDPSLIDIDTKEPTISNIIDKIKYDEIDLTPAFQRSANLWDPGKQSRLIESLLIKIPLPAFYFDVSISPEDSKVHTWEVIDGLQRLCSIKNFMINQTLCLEKLEFLTHLEGKKFSELPRSYQRTIEITQITAFLIKPGTPTNVKFNIFRRVNTGGLPLTQQEIRHALNQGIPSDFIKTLAESQEFKRATANKISPARMFDREFVNRFLAFYLLPHDKYSDMDSFLNSAMVCLSKETEEKLETIKRTFLDSLTTIHKIFGKYAFSKLDAYPRRKPLNKALFEVLTVSFSQLSDTERKMLVDKKDEFMDKIIKLFKGDEKFLGSVSSGTSEAGNIKYRFDQVKLLIKGLLYA